MLEHILLIHSVMLFFVVLDRRVYEGEPQHALNMSLEKKERLRLRLQRDDVMMCFAYHALPRLEHRFRAPLTASYACGTLANSAACAFIKSQEVRCGRCSPGDFNQHDFFSLFFSIQGSR